LIAHVLLNFLVRRYIVSPRTVFGLHDEERIPHAKQNIWLSEFHPGPKPTLQRLVVTSDTTSNRRRAQPIGQNLPSINVHQHPKHSGCESILEALRIWCRLIQFAMKQSLKHSDSVRLSETG
jgi:hypothetical protein